MIADIVIIGLAIQAIVASVRQALQRRSARPLPSRRQPTGVNLLRSATSRHGAWQTKPTERRQSGRARKPASEVQ
jgi:hypothetical protein